MIRFLIDCWETMAKTEIISIHMIQLIIIYLVSDYPLGQYNNSNLQWTSSATWEPPTGGNGVKISLTFDKTGGDANKDNWKVTGATVKIDGKSVNDPNGSKGLTVTVSG